MKLIPAFLITLATLSAPAVAAQEEAAPKVFCAYPMGLAEYKLVLSPDEQHLNLYLNGEKLVEYQWTGATNGEVPTALYTPIKSDMNPEEVGLSYGNGFLVFQDMTFGKCQVHFKPADDAVPFAKN